MVQFAEDKLLQLVGGLALLGVDAGLRKQSLGVDAGLLQQQAKAVVLRRQRGLLRGAWRRTDWGSPSRDPSADKEAVSVMIFKAPSPTIACNSAIICSTPSGLPKKRLSAGRSASDGLTWPETRMILMAGQRSCTAWASFRPSMLPGI